LLLVCDLNQQIEVC